MFKKEYEEFDKSLDLNWAYSKSGKDYFKYRITREDGFVEIVEYNDKIIGYISGGTSKRQGYRKKAKYSELEICWLRRNLEGKALAGN